MASAYKTAVESFGSAVTAAFPKWMLTAATQAAALLSIDVFRCARVAVLAVCAQRYGAPVVDLFLWCSPAAVARLVVPIHVDAVQSPAFRPTPHVFEEGEERTPTVADGDPASAIAGPMVGVGVMAALAHAHPTPVRESQAWVATPAWALEDEWVAVSAPPLEMCIAPSPPANRLSAVRDRACRLIKHREVLSRGVSGWAVSAAPPLYCTPVGVPHG